MMQNKNFIPGTLRKNSEGSWNYFCAEKYSYKFVYNFSKNALKYWNFYNIGLP